MDGGRLLGYGQKRLENDSQRCCCQGDLIGHVQVVSRVKCQEALGPQPLDPSLRQDRRRSRLRQKGRELGIMSFMNDTIRMGKEPRKRHVTRHYREPVRDPDRFVCVVVGAMEDYLNMCMQGQDVLEQRHEPRQRDRIQRHDDCLLSLDATYAAKFEGGSNAVRVGSWTNPITSTSSPHSARLGKSDGLQQYVMGIFHVQCDGGRTGNHPGRCSSCVRNRFSSSWSTCHRNRSTAE